MSFHTILIIINAVAAIAIIGFVVFRVARLHYARREAAPENLTPFFDDDVLENAHLERVLAVALTALVIAVVGMVAYFVWEPFRQTAMATQYNDQSIERGAILFANNQSPHYDSTKSLLCANCHGVDGGGGVATFVIKSQDPRCDPKQTVDAKLAETQPYCLPQQVSWQAPNLQLAGLRYTRQQLTQIITYGRPGTPMPSWGVASGKGALGDQSINDLVNYVESITTDSNKAMALDSKLANDLKTTLAKPETLAAAQKWVADSQANLAAAQTELAAQTSATDKATYEQLVSQQQQHLATAQNWLAVVENPSDGAVLFMSNCARCHTRGWSYFDPTAPQANPLPGPMGGGAYGPNLTGGEVNAQFPPPTGEDDLYTWISVGVPAYQAYGVRGISSGRMAHFGLVLSKAQIEAIMAYERSL
jgi:mono/diheme cytochrome c family protein